MGSEGKLDHHIDGRISCRSYAGSLVRDKSLLYAHGTYSPARDQRRADRGLKLLFCMFEAWMCSGTWSRESLQAKFNADWLIPRFEINKPRETDCRFQQRTDREAP